MNKGKTLAMILLSALLSVALVTILAGCGKQVTHITTVEELLAIKEGGNFVLDNDIDCGGKKWMGFNLNKDLTIDGNGHKIHNVEFVTEGNCFGLVAAAGSYLVFKNLGLENFTINTNKTTSSSSIYAGGFVGLNNGEVKFENCYAKGNIKVDIRNKSNHVGLFCGYVMDGIYENCLTDGEISLHYDDFGFSTATVYAGGFTGYGGWKNYAGGYSPDKYTNCISIVSIDVDTSLSMSWKTTTNVGGFQGFSGDFSAHNCISAPKKLYASTFVNNDVSVGGIKVIGTGKIGAFVGDSAYASNNSRNYYCSYNDETLSAAERAVQCSDYEKLNGRSVGVAVNLSKTIMLSADFLSGDYDYTDANGEVKTAYAKFDGNVWNFGHMDGTTFVLPQLKIFDK